MHKGAYEELRSAYAMQWVDDNGYTISGLMRESYIDGVWNKDNVTDWLTEIQIPVDKK